MLHSTTLTGHGVRLEPIEESHAPDLVAHLDEGMWAGFSRPFPGSADEYRAYIGSQLAAPGTMAFTVVDDDSGERIGSTSLYELAPSQSRVEIGSTWYDRRVWGSHVNPAAKLLLFTHAFETLRLWRVALRCDARNTRSASAIQRLGARPEGRLRGHRSAPDGTRQDTLYFSVLQPEWPAVREGLLARVS